jgi:hypothetical protein
MTAFWVKFSSRKPGCVEAVTAEAAMEAVRELNPVSAERLPYPAAPRLVIVEYGEYGKMPSFCYEPEQCKGYSSCPQRRSCTD